MRFLSAAVTVLLFIATSANLRAQARGEIVGLVGDSAHAPLADVRVTLAGITAHTRTDAKGIFHLHDLKPGTYDVQLRRLGYESLTFAVEVRALDSLALDIQLNTSAVTVATLEVRASTVSRRLIDVGFVDRRRTSIVPASQFVTRDEIARRNPIDLTQLVDRMVGRLKSCANPVIFLDGSLRPQPPRDPPIIAATVKERAQLADPPPRPKVTDGIPPDIVEGIEVYVGPAQIPLQYKAPWRGADCAIVIWTR